jgi:chromosome segregation ATPase
VADIKQRVAEFARDRYLFVEGIRELDGIVAQSRAEGFAEAIKPHTHAELVAAYPKLAERISQSDWERMSIAAQLEWALHQAAHAQTLVEFQAGTIKAYADHVDGLRERIGLMEQRLAGATERKDAAEKRVAELERQAGALASANTVLRQKRDEADRRIAELEAENARHKASARFADLESDNARLKSLSRFTQHKLDCRLNMSATESCTCGFHAALAQKGGE